MKTATKFHVRHQLVGMRGRQVTRSVQSLSRVWNQLVPSNAK